MSTTRIVAVMAALAMAACGATVGDLLRPSSSPPVVMVLAVDPPIVGLPPTPDPPLDPTASPEPQVTLDHAFISELQVELLANGRVRFTLRGDLPTPCHRLMTELGAPDPDGDIFFEVWAEAPAEQICIQVLEPFQITRELDRLGAGEYRVLIGGKEVTSFEVTPDLASDDPRPSAVEDR